MEEKPFTETIVELVDGRTDVRRVRGISTGLVGNDSTEEMLTLLGDVLFTPDTCLLCGGWSEEPFCSICIPKEKV